MKTCLGTPCFQIYKEIDLWEETLLASWKSKPKAKCLRLTQILTFSTQWLISLSNILYHVSFVSENGANFDS